MKNSKNAFGFILCVLVMMITSCEKDNDLTEMKEADFNKEVPLSVANGLTAVEMKLVGSWFGHQTVDGSIHYFIFNPDRTGCSWKQMTPSYRSDKKTFTHWELVDQRKGLYDVMVQRIPSSSILTLEGQFQENINCLTATCDKNKSCFQIGASSLGCE